jgi:hypothetical protein
VPSHGNAAPRGRVRDTIIVAKHRLLRSDERGSKHEVEMDAANQASLGEHRVRDHARLGPLSPGKLIHIRVDGKTLGALDGEPLFAALLAHGISIFRTMPDDSAPRAPFCGTGRCTDCMMTVDGELNVRTCVTPARDGMVVETQLGLGAWKAGR